MPKHRMVVVPVLSENCRLPQITVIYKYITADHFILPRIIIFRKYNFADHSSYPINLVS